MEIKMLETLDFDIDFVSTYRFLERYVQLVKADKLTFDLAQYLVEIAMLDYESIIVRPSYMAISALYLANKIMRKIYPWTK